MNLPRYLEYRDSGLPWLGSVPEHWTFAPLWVLFNRTKRTGFEGEQLLSVYRDHGVVPKASRDDNNNKPSDDLSPYQLVCPGDLAINKMKAWQGSVAISEYRGIVSPAYFVYEAKHQESSRYLHYLMRSPQYVAGYLSMSKGIRINQWDLEPQYHSRLPVLIPPKEEQERIATFLDRETAKIDALIAEQEKLLALLAEKRQATISHAVTRGLNPNAPMKDSGIPWLGEVPAHWEMRRLKTISPAITVGIVVNPSDYVSDTGLPFIYGGDIAEGRISTTSCRRIDPVDSDRQAKTRLNAGDLLTVRVGAPGVTAVVPEECEGGNCASVMLIRRGDFNSDWLCFAMNSRMVRYQVEVVQYGAAQEQFNIGHAIDFWIATPPRDEQDALAVAIGKAVECAESLKGQAEQAVGLLRERRSALISAAVTGKIDVRGAVESPAS